MLTEQDRRNLENARNGSVHRPKSWFIRMMCKECVYDDTEPGTWVKQVAKCTVESCPLFTIRPGT